MLAHGESFRGDLPLGVLQMALIRAMAEARFIAGCVKLPATQDNRTVDPE
jgi:hypothetical protein